MFRAATALTVAALVASPAALARADADVGSTQQSIVGGELVPANQFDEIALLELEDFGFCTGVLIAPNAIATAAHCFYTPRMFEALEQQQERSRSTALTLNDAIDDLEASLARIPDRGDDLAIAVELATTSSPIRRSTVGYRLHPGALPTLVDELKQSLRAVNRAGGPTAAVPPPVTSHDIAIVYFEPPIFDIEPVVFANAADIRTGTPGLAVGYGDTRADHSGADGRLRQLGVSVSDTACASACRPGLEFKTASAPGTEVCSGDSGGPLYVENQSGELVVAGILARADGTGLGNVDPPCDGGQPDIYGRADVVSSWLREAAELGPPESAGCGCRSSENEVSAGLPLLLALLWLAFRRWSRIRGRPPTTL